LVLCETERNKKSLICLHEICQEFLSNTTNRLCLHVQ